MTAARLRSNHRWELPLSKTLWREELRYNIEPTLIEGTL